MQGCPTPAVAVSIIIIVGLKLVTKLPSYRPFLPCHRKVSSISNNRATIVAPQSSSEAIFPRPTKFLIQPQIFSSNIANGPTNDR